MQHFTAADQSRGAIVHNSLHISETSQEYIPLSPPLLLSPFTPSDQRHSHLCDVAELLVKGGYYRQEWRCLLFPLFVLKARSLLLTCIHAAV